MTSDDSEDHGYQKLWAEDVMGMVHRDQTVVRLGTWDWGVIQTEFRVLFDLFAR